MRAKMLLVIGLCLGGVLVAYLWPTLCRTDNERMDTLYTEGKYAEATPLARRILEKAEKNFGPDHPDTAKALHNLAELYRLQEKYTEAEPFFKRSLAVNEKLHGTDSPYVAKTLHMLANLCQLQARHAEAETLYKRSLTIFEKTLGPDHPEFALALTSMAALCIEQAKYVEAESFLKRSLALSEKALGPDHPEMASALDKLVDLYRIQGKYAEAEPLCRRALAINEKVLAPNHPDLVYTLGNMAELYHALGKHLDAEPLYKRSLAIAEKARGPDHHAVATALNNLAQLYRNMGLYPLAEPLYKRSLAIAEKARGPDHPEIATTLNNMGALYLYQGRYAEASPLLKRSLTIREKALGPDHHAVATSLIHMAWLCESLGNYAEAELLFDRALAIEEKALGPDHPEMGSLLNRLGGLCSHKGDYKTALAHLQRALLIYSKSRLPQKERTKDQIAHLYMNMGELGLAEPLVGYAGFNTTTGRFHLLNSNYDAARQSYERSLEWAEMARDADTLFIAHTGLGMAHEGLGDNAQAALHFRKAVDFTEELRSSLDRGQRERFFDVRVKGFFRTAPYEGLARVLLKMEGQDEAFKFSEYSKARVFAEQISRRPPDVQLDVPTDLLQVDEELTNQLAALMQQREKAYKDLNKALIDTLEPRVAELRQKLASHVKVLREKHPLFAASKYPDPTDLGRAALKENEWALSYDVTDPGIIVYLTRGKELIKAVFKSVPRRELDDMVRRFREPFEVGREGLTATKLKSFDLDVAKRLADALVWEVLPYLPEGVPVIVAPDDSLGVVPFEALVLNSGGEVKTDRNIAYCAGVKFFGDRNPISYAQSITALTLSRTVGTREDPSERLLVIADPVFLAIDQRARLAKPAQIASTQEEFIQGLMANMEAPSDGGFTFERLVRTEELARNLAALFKDDSDSYLGLEATKDTFLNRLAPSLFRYGYMVFATHGFFNKNNPVLLEPVLVLTTVPLGTDGFLRLSEVMGLKLNADVVALTACQTGLGQRISGEGTMGMGRAFQYAGARSVLMSLWSVSEASSVQLVEVFFRKLKEGKNKLQALQAARKEIREQGYDHPFFWAPFILVGEVN